ncbi:MAG: M23 family metallopeptidase [Cyanobacteria bacterium J06600_6]
MVKIAAIGLLIAGTAPIALADSSTVKFEEDRLAISNLSSTRPVCKKFNSDCVDKQEQIQQGIKGNLWFKDVAKSILPSSPFLVCDRQGRGKSRQQSWSRGRQLRQNDLSLSSLGKFANSICGFNWRDQLDRQAFTLKPNKISNNTLKLNSTKSYKVVPPFPKINRSSLIVDFPLSNSTFIPPSTKLANPAPATKRIASPFGWRNRPYSNQLQFHQGIDYGAPYGSDVVSVGKGIVTRVVSGCADFGSLFCGGQLGNWIEVDHGNGIIGTYGHLKRGSITVKEGVRVGRNQTIAEVGSSGWSTGAHLDFRLKVNGKHEDPMKYVMAIDPQRAKQKLLK